jgi:hypothetical protein
MANIDEIILGEIYEVEVYDADGDVDGAEEEYGEIHNNWFIELLEKKSENVISGFILSGRNGMRLGYAELHINHPTNLVYIDAMYFTLYILQTMKRCYTKQNAAILAMKNAAAENIEN